jgi:hypothetical protein
MLKLFLAAAAGTCVLGGALIAQTAQAQPYGYYAPGYYGQAPAYRYDAYGYRSWRHRYGDVPYDAYGPDPNGMIAADGHRLKCKLRDDWDDRYDRYVTHRVCY